MGGSGACCVYNILSNNSLYSLFTCLPLPCLMIFGFGFFANRNSDNVFERNNTGDSSRPSTSWINDYDQSCVIVDHERGTFAYFDGDESVVSRCLWKKY